MVLYSNKYLGIYSLVGKRRSENGINLVFKENSSSFWCNTEHRLRLDTTQSRQPTWLKGAETPILYHSSALRLFWRGFFPLNLTGILLFEGSFSYDFLAGDSSCGEGPGRLCLEFFIYFLFSLKMKLGFCLHGRMG